MTFLEALRADRPMRRTSWWQDQVGSRWLILDAEGEWWWFGGEAAKPPTRADMLGDDWKVLP